MKRRRVPRPSLPALRRDGAPRQQVAGVERTVCVEFGRVGVEVRPTRVLLRAGRTRQLVRVVPLSSRPRPLRRARRARGVKAGPVSVTFVGSPAVTVALAGVHAVGRNLRRG